MKPCVERAVQEESLPLSAAQRRLWALDQLGPKGLAYHISVVIRLTGQLCLVALTQSLDEIVRRHEVLRSTFAMIDGQPFQIIAPVMTLPLCLVDLQELSVAEQTAQVQHWFTQEAQRPFDLARGPLARAVLLRLNNTEHLLLVTAHKIVSDDHLSGIVARELAVIYPALATGKPSPLAELPIQYSDVSAQQREWLQGEEAAAQRSYWEKQLGDAPAALELATDWPRPPLQTFRGAQASRLLPGTLTAALATLSQQEGATLFEILLASFKALLYRYTGQTDLLIGSPATGCRSPETRELIGPLTNMLVLRTDLSGASKLTFRELLGRVRQTVREAFAHPDVPFELLVEELQPERNLSHSPLFQVMFTLQNTLDELALDMPTPGLDLSLLDIDFRVSEFDLTLKIVNSVQGLETTIKYNTDLFNLATISRLLGHFHTLLESASVNPDQRLSALLLLTASEQQQLVEWANTLFDLPATACTGIHEMFEAQAERTPDSVAIVFDPQAGHYRDQHVTYRELNCRANQLARHLQLLGVEPDTLVGLYMERSPEMIEGILASLKAGGAYVPLDPDYPKERLAFMLADTHMSVVLTQAKLSDGLAGCESAIVRVDALEALTQESTENLPPVALADNLAYLIYTSGSSGTPKGAMLSHRAICNRMSLEPLIFPSAGEERVLQATLLSFDASVWECFKPLLTGGALILAQPGGHRDSAYLVKLISEQQITLVGFVPSMLQVFLEEPAVGTCSCLKHVFCGGEALTSELVGRFLARLDAELYNLYGPTEACIDTTFWNCRHGNYQQSVPIGRPLPNTQVWVLDQHLNPVPIGMPGELHIGGDCLARGYLNRPDLSADKFIPNPLASLYPSPQTGREPGKGTRLYKTGDHVRYLPDGTIEFLGRMDRQAKIRGFRLELGEIEAALRQHPSIKEAIVLVQEQREEHMQHRQQAQTLATLENMDISALTRQILSHDPGNVERLLTEIEKLQDEQVEVTLDR